MTGFKVQRPTVERRGIKDMTEEYKDSVEVLWFTCCFCGGSVATYWMADNTGMFPDKNSVLLGDWVAHPKCFDESWAKYEAEKEEADKVVPLGGSDPPSSV